jgi:hypothetical protein
VGAALPSVASSRKAALGFKIKMIALDHLDSTIRVFKPDIDLETVKTKTVPSRHQALPGEMIRGVLTVLRESKKPLTSMEITLLVMARRVMNANDKALVRTVSKRVIACVRHARNAIRGC